MVWVEKIMQKLHKKLYKTKLLPPSLFSFKIELIENKDILHGYTDIKTDCKTQAWCPFFMSSFWKIYDWIKNIQSYKIFSKTCSMEFDEWNFRIPKLNIFSR